MALPGQRYNGSEVYRVFRPAANLPQTAQGNLFVVSGGPVRVTHISGRVTTAIQNQADNTKVVFDPLIGTDVDLCAVASVANLAKDVLLGITGTLATALQTGLAIVGQSTPLVLGPGYIALNCAASNTGQIEWTIVYQRIDGRGVVTKV